MIQYVDEIQHFEETGKLFLGDEPVHLRHFKDGYPLCWPMDKEGPFVGSYEDTEVTCKECLNLLVEDPDEEKPEDQEERREEDNSTPHGVRTILPA